MMASTSVSVVYLEVEQGKHRPQQGACLGCHPATHSVHPPIVTGFLRLGELLREPTGTRRSGLIFPSFRRAAFSPGMVSLLATTSFALHTPLALWFDRRMLPSRPCCATS